MRCIIAGTRTVTRPEHLREALAACGWAGEVREVVSGACPDSPDMLGEAWAAEQRLPVRRFRPDWKGLGRAAGPIRNAEMCRNADALIALWDGRSPGTASAIRLAREHGLRVYVHPVPTPVLWRAVGAESWEAEGVALRPERWVDAPAGRKREWRIWPRPDEPRHIGWQAYRPGRDDGARLHPEVVAVVHERAAVALARWRVEAA